MNSLGWEGFSQVRKKIDRPALPVCRFAASHFVLASLRVQTLEKILPEQCEALKRNVVSPPDAIAAFELEGVFNVTDFRRFAVRLANHLDHIETDIGRT